MLPDFAPPSLGITILVHRDTRVLDARAQALSEQQGWLLLDVGKAVSARLLQVPVQQRATQTLPVLEDALRCIPGEPRGLYRIDLLFEPSLELDPLHLFERLASRWRLIVFWPGDLQNGTLTYAGPEHAHYRAWKRWSSSVQVQLLTSSRF